MDHPPCVRWSPAVGPRTIRAQRCRGQTQNPSHGRRGCTNDETAIGKAASAKHRLRTPTAPVIASWHPWHRREATACHAARAISPLGEPSASSQTARGEPRSRRRSLPPEMMQPAGMRQHLRRTGLVFLQELIEHCRPARITPFRGSHDTTAGHVRRSGSVRCLDLPLQGPVPKGTTQLTSQWVANQRNLLGGPGMTDAPTGLIADVLHIGGMLAAYPSTAAADKSPEPRVMQTGRGPLQTAVGGRMVHTGLGIHPVSVKGGGSIHPIRAGARTSWQKKAGWGRAPRAMGLRR